MAYHIKLYREKGLCVDCGKRPARESHQTCCECAEKRRRRYRGKKGAQAGESKPNHTIGDIVRYAQAHGISYGQAVLIIDEEDKEKCVN